MRTFLTVFGRSVFLASSWTWVIGMFFPILLIKDFGAWAFLPFALFNVLGAMSVGVLLSSKKAEDAYATDLVARALFSIATVAFHVFFIAALAGAHLPGILDHIPSVGPDEGQLRIDSLESVGIVTIVLLMVPYAIARKERPPWVRLALGVVVFTLSIACAGLAYVTTRNGHAFATPPAEGEFGLGALGFTSMGLAFGFLLCPYLDQSIVRIRSITPGATGRLVSALGFGVFFLAMILFTFAYAQAFLGGAWFSYYFLLHILAQAMFTTGVHMGELRRMAERHPRVPGGLLFWGTMFACIASAAAGLFTHPEGTSLPRGDAFVLVYRAFLSLYGVAFPLYVWAVMVPAPGLRNRPRKARMAGFWVALALASGPFAFGFLMPVWWLVGLGVFVALFVPIVVAGLVSKTPS